MKYPDAYEVLLNMCESRKSTRAFDGRAVPGEMIEKIKKLAYTAPYASGKKNWEITVVTDVTLLERMRFVVETRTQEIRDKIRADMQDSFTAYARNFALFASAPAVLVLTFRAAPSLSLLLPSEDKVLCQWERENYVKSISCVAMLILLAAESLGLGGCYVTGALVAEEKIAELINIPVGRSIGALIPIGFKRGDAT